MRNTLLIPEGAMIKEKDEGGRMNTRVYPFWILDSGFGIEEGEDDGDGAGEGGKRMLM